MMEIKPIRVFYLFALLGAILIALSWLLPKNGLQVSNNLKIKWITLAEFLPIDNPNTTRPNITGDSTVTTNQIVNHALANIQDSVVNTELKDSTENGKVFEHNNLYYNNIGRENINSFFNRLHTTDSINPPLHILHIGDSQLDGDRITRYLRELFQTRFGGSGCGLVNCLDPVKQISSVWIDSKGSWVINWLYDEFRQQNNTPYGLLGSITSAQIIGESSVVFTPSPLGNKNCGNYQEARLFISATASNQLVTCYADRALYQIDTLSTAVQIQTLKYHFPYPPHHLEFSIRADNSSPLLHGCALDAMHGVQIDNIALRGQMFTRFLKRDSVLVSTMAKSLNPALVILQFGANLLPTKAPEYKSYQRQIEHQISLIKLFIPTAAIMVVGVGDAAERIDGQVKTLSSVQPITGAQKQAAINSGALFFDLFSAMGGEGTMVMWADNEPKRALSDYIHFNQRGGKAVATLIFNALNDDYNMWLQQQKNKPL